jgi:amino acid adenylation domain-containing protein
VFVHRHERVHQAFERQVRLTPERVAVVVGERRLDYAEVNRRANRVARALVAAGVPRGALVGVCLPREEWLLPALLGVLKAGAAYVPLDPAYPADRLAGTAADAALTHVLVAPATAGLVPAAAEIAVGAGLPADGADLDLPGEPADAAYVIYTSGSTGRPKGVVVEHRSLLNLVAYQAGLLSDAERAGMLAAASVCFDASVLETFPALLSGGTVILAADLLALPTLPARDEVTTVFGVPSVLAELLREPLPAGVRTVLAGGEAVTAALAARAHANPAVTRVLNLYGPTEATVYCAAQEVAAGAGGEVPIGTAVAGAELSVRDAGGEPVPDGTEGELWVAGPVLARGYLDRAELTAERFVTDAAGTRHYRTGDLAVRAGDRYAYRGRADDQVKVRGFRIELGEVRAALAAHPQVTQAVVLAVADDWGTRRLVGYAQAAGVAERELREYVAGRLPAHMVPSRIAVLDRLPVGASGKVDRAALPEVAFGRDELVPYVAPRTASEAAAAEVVAEVLGLPAVGVHDRFVDLGGHSLAAARVCALLGRRLSVAVPVARFLAAPTVEGLAALADTAAPQVPLVRHAGRDAYPLTAMQRGFWTLRELDPETAATTVAIRLRLTGVSGARVRAALDGLVHRHEVMRTSFVRDGAGPAALVRPPVAVPLVEHDARGLTAAAREGLARAAATHTFDLADEVPLLRATLLWLADDRAELVLTADHTAFDGASIRPLMAELTAELAGEVVPAPALQVGDVALHEQATGGGDAAGFWRGELAEAAFPDDLPGRRRGARPSRRGARVRRLVEPALVERLARFAGSRGLTSYAVWLAALEIVVAGLSGRTDTVVGVAVARRDLPGTPEIIGGFGAVLPVTADLAGDPTFGTVAERAAAAHLDAPPGDALRGELGRPAGSLLTPVLLSVQPPDAPLVVARGDVTVEYLGDLGAGGTQGELSVFVTAGVGGTELQVEHDVALYPEDAAAALADRVLAVLAAALADPDAPVSAYPLVTAAERAALLRDGCGPDLPAGGTVVEAILAAAAERPDAVAVTGPAGALTYAELAAASARIAAALVAAGAGPGDPVGVCVPRDHLLPAALLGVLRAGAAYLPMDPEYPADRLAWLAADAGAALVLSRATALPAAQAVPGVHVVDADGPAPEKMLPAVDPDGLAYVLYTSGSTGRPKGVEISHANLAAHTRSLRERPGMGPADAMLALSPLTFDAVGIEIWAPLSVGARCVVVERDCVLDGRALAARLAAVGASTVFLPPTLLRMLLAAGWGGDPELTVWSGGEAVDAALARDVLPRIAALWNVYGPTETTTVTTAHRVCETDEAGVPIGLPLPGERTYVVDPLGRLVPPGAIGELWIGGAGVAVGYRGRPELTAAAFVPDPFVPGGRCYRTGDLVRWTEAGLLDFVGRRDHQVKVRGQRMELGEIEAALHDLPGIAQAVVTVHGTGSAVSLVGYLAPAGVDTAAVERGLRERLPEYMVPRRWVRLPAVPVLPSGKVDRRALPPPEDVPRHGEPPAAGLEQFVAEVWAEVTGAAVVFRDDDFFALGGNSFAATRVTGRLHAVLGCEIPVRVLFERAVLADFAAEVELLALAQLEREQNADTGALR